MRYRLQIGLQGRIYRYAGPGATPGNDLVTVTFEAPKGGAVTLVSGAAVRAVQVSLASVVHMMSAPSSRMKESFVF